MSRLTAFAAITSLWLAGCAGQKASPAPPNSEGEAAETEEVAGESEAALDEAAPLPESDEASDAPSEAESAKAEPDKEGPKKECSALDKSTCEVTLGCAWSSAKKCVEQK